MRTPILFLVIPVLLLNAGCNSEKKVAAQPSAAEPVVPAVEKQPTAATLTPVVEDQPTMFEWRGIHDGMTVAEFQAKDGRNCSGLAGGRYAMHRRVNVIQTE